MTARTTTGSGSAHPALDELMNLLYNPDFSCNPDRTLAILNGQLGRIAPLTHAAIRALDEKEAAAAAALLRGVLKDRRGDVIARAKKRLLGG